jgi:hypothetical protein
MEDLVLGEKVSISYIPEPRPGLEDRDLTAKKWENNHEKWWQNGDITVKLWGYHLDEFNNALTVTSLESWLVSGIIPKWPYLIYFQVRELSEISHIYI